MPCGVAVSPSSAILIADSGNSTVRRILLPPVLASFNPAQAHAGDSITIIGERFDGRSPAGNIVTFTKAGGGQTTAVVNAASRTQLTVTVPADAATGPLSVQTQGGTASSATNFVVLPPAPVISNFSPTHGAIGSSVTLSGSNLQVAGGPTSVTFAGSGGNRLSALVTSLSATQAVVTVPNAAVTGTIELTTLGGTAATAQPFTVEVDGYQLTVAPAVASAVQHTQASYVVSVTSSTTTFSQLASLTVTGLPSGVEASFSPGQITAGATSTLTLNLTNAELAAGSYGLTIRAEALVEGSPLVRTATATLSVIAAGQTTLSGRVMSGDDLPILGATVSLDGRTATTDAAGNFLLSGVGAGENRALMIDGRTAAAPNRTYPVILEPATVMAGQANVVPYTFYLPAIDTQYEVEVVPGQNTVATNPRVPGLSMTIPAGANLRNRDGSPVARVSITPVAIDRTPAPLPVDVGTTLVFTSQPGGAVSDVAMPVVYPNLAGADPDTRVELYAFNHDTVSWYVYGYGRVSADGRSIVPEVDPATGKAYGLRDFSWHFANVSSPGNTSPDDGCAKSHTGRPVDLATGEKIEEITDVTFGGARGGVELTRIYTSDLSGACPNCPFGRGWTHNYDVRLTGAFDAGGAGRVVMPGQVAGRLFSYVGTEGDGTLEFGTTATVSQLGDVVRKFTDGTYEYRYKSGGVMRFDASGRLQAQVDRNGNTTALTYTGANLTRITDAVGRSVVLAYDGEGRIIKATDPLGREWGYTYEAPLGGLSGPALATVTDPLGQVMRYGYNQLGALQEVIDRRGNVVKRISHDDAVRVIGQEFADGGIERYEYSLSGTVITGVKVTDALGRVTTKRFNASGYVTEEMDGLGQKTSIDLDLTTNLAKSTSGPCGCAEVTRQFDERGNVTAATNRLGQTVRYEYDGTFNNVTRIIDQLNRATAFSYDTHGNLVAVTDALNQTTNLTYDDFGELISITDPLGHTTRFEYDAQGNQVANVDALGHRATIEYDIVGRAISVNDALGHQSTAQYDALDRVIAITDPAEATTNFSYDANNNQTGVSDALNRQWIADYDVKNRLVTSTDPLNRTSQLTYDRDDEMTAATSPSGRAVHYEYDERGQNVQLTDALNGVVRFSYDHRGNLLAVSDQRGGLMSFIYDELYRPISGRDPLGRESTLRYDAMGRVIESVDRLGRRVTLAYDGIDRLTSAIYTDATVNYSYDAASRPTRIDDTQSGTVNWSYDEADRLLSETTPAGLVQYEYNAAGQVTSMTAADRAAAVYGYDNAGRLQSITQGSETFTYSYDTLSRLASLQRPNGVTTGYTYDAVNRLTRLLHTNAQSQAIEDYQYSYDLDDEIASITALASVLSLPQTKSASPADAANRISQFGSASYTFDQLGQTTTKTDVQGTTTYNWDARGRMTSAGLPNGQTVRYSYDALGRRASRSDGGATTTFLYDGTDVVLDRNSDGSSIDYLNGLGIDEKLRQTSSFGTHYFLQDYLGSTTALVDTNGAVVERQAYEPYGRTGSSSLTRYGYTGRELDSVTGLMYYRARWYDPQQGRFLSEDPSGYESGSLNLFSYADNSPSNATDPFGLAPDPKHKELCEKWQKAVDNIKKDIAKRIGERHEDIEKLPWRAPGDIEKPRLSRWGHEKIINELKARKAELEAYLKAYCDDCDKDDQQAADAAKAKAKQINDMKSEAAEYQAMAESYRYQSRAWAAITVGGTLIVIVLTGGAALRAGGGATGAGGGTVVQFTKEAFREAVREALPNAARVYP